MVAEPYEGQLAYSIYQEGLGDTTNGLRNQDETEVIADEGNEVSSPASDDCGQGPKFELKKERYFSKIAS